MNITPVELVLESLLHQPFSEPVYRPDLLLRIHIDSVFLPPNLQSAIAHMRKERNCVAHATADTLEAGGDDNYEILHGEYVTAKQRTLTIQHPPFGLVTIHSRQQISKPHSPLDNVADWQIEYALSLAKHEGRYHEQLSAACNGNFHPALILIASATPNKSYSISDVTKHFYERTETYHEKKIVLHFLHGLHQLAQYAMIAHKEQRLAK